MEFLSIMKILLLFLITTIGFSQVPIRVSGKQVTFNGNEGKTVTWTTYGPGAYFTELQSQVITKGLKIQIEELANFWIIKGKDTTSVWIITPTEKDMVLTIVVNGRTLRNGKIVPREYWDYRSFKAEIEKSYSEKEEDY